MPDGYEFISGIEGARAEARTVWNLLQLSKHEVIQAGIQLNGSRIEMTDVWDATHDESTPIFSIKEQPG